MTVYTTDKGPSVQAAQGHVTWGLKGKELICKELMDDETGYKNKGGGKGPKNKGPGGL
jgi:hypothetical protein